MEWCPKYRYKMFRKDKYKNLVNTCIRKAAEEHNIEIIELNVMPDYLHTVVKIPLTRGKFATSVGYSDLPTTIYYVQYQEEHHCSTLT